MLRLAEEQLEVGKRRIDAGKTRIRRYVVERPVISKKTRVAEEVMLRRGETERVETVKDTVRKQQVEIERLDEKGNVIRE